MLPRPFHHVGCAVRAIEASPLHGDLLGVWRRSPIIEVASQGTRVCFVELAPGSYLELVDAPRAPSPVERFTRVGFYHLCFLAEDLPGAVAELTARRCVALKPFSSEAFGGKTCQFVMTPEGHLLELAETTPEAFAAWFGGVAAVPG